MNSERIYQADIVNREGKTTRKQLVYEKGSASGVVKYIDMTLSWSDTHTHSAPISPIIRNDVVRNLVPFSKIVKLKKHVSRKTALKLYYEDLRNLLNVKDLYIGDIGILIGEDIHLQPCLQSVLHNRLLLQCERKFLDLDDYNTYDSITNMSIGDVGVINKQQFVSAFQGEIERLEMPKQKILEMYHERYQEKR